VAKSQTPHTSPHYSRQTVYSETYAQPSHQGLRSYQVSDNGLPKMDLHADIYGLGTSRSIRRLRGKHTARPRQRAGQVPRRRPVSRTDPADHHVSTINTAISLDDMTRTRSTTASLLSNGFAMAFSLRSAPLYDRFSRISYKRYPPRFDTRHTFLTAYQRIFLCASHLAWSLLSIPFYPRYTFPLWLWPLRCFAGSV
jgi:hypothetical protein